MSMKKYRIKNYYDAGYILQKRYWVFFWYTIVETDGNHVYYFPKRIFNSVSDAKDHLDSLIESKENIKKAKYTEYL